jgi:hypothetical protein
MIHWYLNNLVNLTPGPMFLFRNSIIGPSKGLEQTKNIEGLQNDLGPIIKHSILKSDVLKKIRTANSDLPSHHRNSKHNDNISLSLLNISLYIISLFLLYVIGNK